MENCKKCGSKNVDIKFTPRDYVINSSSLARVNNEFIRSSEYDLFYKLIAKKDHLRVKCNNCGNIERVRTLDDKSAV